MDYPSSSSSIAASRLELGGADGTSQEEEERERDQRERNFNGELQVVEKEHMFDKVVTPSDVGKLNRLVIPKQHAEKYFPLDSSRDEKGLLLNFEDRTGKSWRFRYSYWNSSQSYVMTKGWSRFVKEKKLDAGDIVSFHRTVGGEKFFIDWRRRRLPDAPPLLQYISVRPPPPLSPFVLRSSSGITTATPYHLNFHQNQLHIHHLHHHHHHHPYDCDNPNPYPIWDHLNSNSSSSSTATTYTHLPPMNVVRSTVPSGAPHSHWIRNMVNFSASPTSNTQFSQVLLPSSGTPSPTDFRREDGGEEEHRGTERMVFDSVPVVQGKAAGKRLRLFGVNMDCANHNNDMSRDYNYEDAAAAAVASAVPTSISDDRRLRVHHRRQAAEALGLASESSDHGKRLPLQLRLPVDKGKLSSSSSSSMSLDLDM